MHFTSLKYLFDEHLAHEYLTQYLARNPLAQALHVGGPGAPPLGTADPDILHWCEANGFLLLTNNRKSMPRHLQDHLASGRHIPGILILSRATPYGSIIENLQLVAETSEQDEYQDQIIPFPLS